MIGILKKFLHTIDEFNLQLVLKGKTFLGMKAHDLLNNFSTSLEGNALKHRQDPESTPFEAINLSHREAFQSC